MKDIDKLIQYAKDNGLKVGTVVEDICGITSQISGFPDYKKGMLVLFKESPRVPDSFLEGPNGLRKQENTLTISRHNPKIGLVGTMSCVPEKCVDEYSF